MWTLGARGLRFSVRTVLGAILAIAALPAILFAVFVLFDYADSERARAEIALMDSARGVARAIDSEFSTAVAALRVLSNSALLEQDDIEAFSQRLKNTDFGQDRGFILASNEGELILNSSAFQDSQLGIIPFQKLKQSFTTNRVFISDVLVVKNAHQPFVFVAVPILRGDALKWTLGTFFFSDDFTDLIRKPGVPQNWIVSLVDRRGTHITRSHLNEEYAGRPLVPVLVRHMERGGVGTIRTVSHEGIKLISTVEFASDSGFATAIGLPVKTLEAPMEDLLFSLSLTGLMLLGIALTLAFLVAGTLIRAFSLLRTSARALGQGKLVAPSSSMIREANDVVSTMSNVSHVLAQRTEDLQKLNTTLERRVESRTAELIAEMEEREKTEAQLRHLHRLEAVGSLTGGIAHDFNNMLSVIMSGIDLAQRRLKRGDTDVGKYLDGALQGAENAAKLTQRLLAFSRQQTLNPVVIDCNRLLSTISELIRRTLPENILIETVLAAGLWKIQVDSSGLENAILNIAVNARDAMPDGGKLTIETSNAHLDESYARSNVEVTSGQYVMIAITDTGEGIPQDVLAKVFEPFFSTKEVGHGTGLGLSQVHGFIKQSGGHVKIYSEPGEGTSVKIYLPRTHADLPDGREREDTPEISPVNAGNESILTVEDDAAVREITVQMLEDLGYRIFQAKDAPTALAILKEHPEIELMMTDVVMPGMNGKLLADEAVALNADLKVIFTTGYTRNAIVHHGILDPGVQLIVKPYTQDALAKKISEVLAKDN